MANVIERCAIKGFKPTGRTLDAIKNMEYISDVSNVLVGLLGGTPLFHLFAGRQTYTGGSTAASSVNITIYDWERFAMAMNSLPKVEREALRRIAEQEEYFGKGKDRMFWSCVHNELL